MSSFLLGILVGAMIMDFLWAWKFGIPQMFWSRLKFGISKLYKIWKYSK